MYNKIHHIAFICRDLDRVVEYYRDVMGFDYRGTHKLHRRKVEIALFQIGETLLEFVHPYDKEAPRNFLQKKGEGFFHIAFGVDDLKQKWKYLLKKGVEFKENAPRRGLDWNLITLKKSPPGIITQLVEEK